VKLSYKNPFLTHTFHDFHLIFKNDTVPKTDSLLNKIPTFWMETKISHIFWLLHLTLYLDPDPDLKKTWIRIRKNAYGTATLTFSMMSLF